MEEKMNRKCEGIKNPLKKSNKTIKQVRETVQDLKIEIGTKKTQNKGIL